LIEVEELSHRLGEPGLKVLDVRMKAVTGGAQSGVQTAYIPGAQILDLEQFSDLANPLPHSALTADEFAKRVKTLGINTGDEVVVYDEMGIYSSPRARYLFLNAGHSKVRVLNGGLPAWVAAGKSVSSVEARVAPNVLGDFVARPPLRTFVDRQEVADVIHKKNSVLVDARSTDRFEGRVAEPRAGLNRGHIPTACSLPFSSVLDGNRMRSPEQLAKILPPGGPEQEVIAYCGSGVTACIVELAYEVAGFKKVRVYDGSWSEWGSTVVKP
jgi:thiosulfate/3-mercaptopyruvate sulfurtransferase